MNSKPKLSVELRKSLADFIEYSVMGPYGDDAMWQANKAELRALLDKPEPEPVPVPVAWMRFDDDQKAIFTRSKRAEDSEALYVHPTAYRVPRSEPPASTGRPLAIRGDHDMENDNLWVEQHGSSQPD